MSGDLADVTALPVSFAFLATREARPAEDDWKEGSWDPAPTTSGQQPATAKLPAISREFVRVPVFPEDEEGGTVDAVARCLVGPGGTVELAVGKWYTWLRISGAVERPVRPVGTLTII